MNTFDGGFVALADLLADGFDTPAQRNQSIALCAGLLNVRAASLLALEQDSLPVLEAASGETADLLTRLELVWGHGPGTDVLRGGDRTECADLTTARLRWPRFAPVALDVGVAAVCALPCQLSGRVVGALTLYLSAPGTLSEDSAEYGRGLATTVALAVTARRGRDQAVRAEQLQGALDSRVAIEQAKGVLAERERITVGEAFTILRNHARGTGTKLHDVARDVVGSTLDPHARAEPTRVQQPAD